MKTKPFKILGVILFVCLSINAQKQNHSKIYNEEFSTNKDVVIDVNTRNTDVKIETWNKNKVSIEAIIEVEGAEGERAERTLDNWRFNAVGNKSEVEISSKSSGGSNYQFSSNDNNRIIVNGKLNEEYNYDYDFPEIEFDNLIELNNDIMVFPEMPELPVMHGFHFDFEDALPKFDYEKYKKDKSYLKKWQKEMEENLEKNKMNWEKDAEKAKEHTAVLKVELEKMAEQRNKKLEAIKKLRKKRIEQVKVQKQVKKQQLLIRKKQVEKSKAVNDKKRNIIIGVLADRDKVKVKRTIIIKAPKDAKFKMNVKYGTISFPK